MLLFDNLVNQHKRGIYVNSAGSVQVALQWLVMKRVFQDFGNLLFCDFKPKTFALRHFGKIAVDFFEKSSKYATAHYP